MYTDECGYPLTSEVCTCVRAVCHYPTLTDVCHCLSHYPPSREKELKVRQINWCPAVNGHNAVGDSQQVCASVL